MAGVTGRAGSERTRGPLLIHCFEYRGGRGIPGTRTGGKERQAAAGAIIYMITGRGDTMKKARAGEIVRGQCYTLDAAGKRKAGTITWKVAERTAGTRKERHFDFVSFTGARA